jgi:predicted porin
MQKKIIALAVAGLVSGAAFAQTNVTLYGRLDVGYIYSKSDYKKFSGVENGPSTSGGSSRIGLRGEEALGNGLKAIFEAEWGSAFDEGSAAVNARWAYVGLSGNFGRVIAGRLKTPTDLYAGATSYNGINGLHPVNTLRGKFGTYGSDGFYSAPASEGMGDILTGSRWNNSIGYTSPNFSGVEVAAVYSFGEKVSGTEHRDANGDKIGYGTNNRKAADVSDAAKYGLGVKYANGPLYLMAAYEARQDNDNAKPYDGDSDLGFGAKGWTVGGSYDFKVVKVYANYYRFKANDNGGFANNQGTDKQSLWSVGLDAPVSSAGTVSLEYAQYKDYLDNRYNANLGSRKAGDKTKAFSVGYKHVLSKRTWLYGYVSHFDNDSGLNGGWTKTGVEGEKQTNFVTGIVHLF